MKVVLDEGAVMPGYAHEYDAGLDLYQKEPDKASTSAGKRLWMFSDGGWSTMCCLDRWICLRRKNMSKHRPCCGAEIMAGQEVCLNCLVYLLEV